MESTQDATTVTVAQVDALVQTLFEHEKRKEEIEGSLKELNKAIAQLEGRCVQFLKDLGRDEYSSPHGKIKIAQKWRVNLPVSDQEKKELFDHLRERGIFDKYATVNSNSLNSLYMKDWEVAKKRGEGMEFSMPGIQAPKLFEALAFKVTK